jgi:hypothetical protein
VLFILSSTPICLSQALSYYSRLNTFSSYTEYSNTSSHIEWGVSRKRKLISAGGSYARRFNAPHWFNWTQHASVFYEIEASPFNFLQDPVATYTNKNAPNEKPFVFIPDAACQPGITSTVFPGETDVVTCATRWTYMGGASPVGFRVNLLPTHKVQPFIDSHLGFLVSKRDEPVANSSSFNFAFEFGAGLEVYQHNGQSVGVEYRLHHFSNAYLSSNNPGVDSQIVRVTYAFGKLRK